MTEDELPVCPLQARKQLKPSPRRAFLSSANRVSLYLKALKKKKKVSFVTPGIEVKLDSVLNPHPRMKPMGIHPGGSFTPRGVHSGPGTEWDPHGLMRACVCVCVRALTGYLWVSDVSLFLALLDIFMAVW